MTDVNGAPFHFGDTVQFDVQVEDDQPVDCSKVRVTYVLGHDQHGHPITTAFGCTGTITTSVPSGHDPATDNLRAVFDAAYTDAGSGNLPPLTGTDEVVLNPAPLALAQASGTGLPPCTAGAGPAVSASRRQRSRRCR